MDNSPDCSPVFLSNTLTFPLYSFTYTLSIAAEVTLYADKICVDEELVRLKSHITGVKAALLEEDGVGRKLDFMAQEMNREANTILSKSGGLDITNHAIELKTEIEKIREQIQNIE